MSAQAGPVAAGGEPTTEEERARAMSQIDDTLTLLVSEPPYYSSVFSLFRFRITRDVPTAAVDASLRLFINPDFWDGLSYAERGGVMTHEILHVVREHLARAGTNAGVKWNMAADLEINDDVLEAKWKLPAKALFAEKFDLESHQTAEWYYSKIPVTEVRCGFGGEGESCLNPNGDGQGPSAGSIGEALDASAAGMLAGKCPEGLKRWAQERMTPQVNWRALLSKFLYRVKADVIAGRSDYSYRRPSRRSLSLGALRGAAPYFPKMFESPMTAAVIVDTSSSLGKEELSVLVGEAGGVCAAVANETHVFACDTEVEYVGKFRSPAEMAGRDYAGGGGADMGAGLAAAADVEPDVAVALTDGYASWPEDKPGFPVVIVLTCDGGEDYLPRWAEDTVKIDV